MTHEKTYVLTTGRSVKVITQGTIPVDQSDIEIELAVLVKEPKEESFHPPIGLTHPKYWKLKRLNPEESRMIEIQYSGLSDKQIRNAVKEFRQILLSKNLEAAN